MKNPKNRTCENSHRKWLWIVLVCTIGVFELYPFSLLAKTEYLTAKNENSIIFQNNFLPSVSSYELSAFIELQNFSENCSHTFTEKKSWIISLLNLLIKMSQKHETIETEGKLPLIRKKNNFAAQSDSIVTVRFNSFNLSDINDLVNEEKWRNFEGLIDGYLIITISPENMQFEGEINLHNGGFTLTPTGMRLDEIETTLLIETNQLVIKNFTAKSGRGIMSMNGEITFEDSLTKTIDIDINAQNFTVANTEQYKGSADMNLHVGGAILRPELNGEIAVLSGFVELSNFGEDSIEDVILDASLAPTYDINLFDSFSVDIEALFNERFFVRNQQYLEMQIELVGSLNLLKEKNENLQLIGTLKTVDGYTKPLGKRFELEEGKFAYSGAIDNPQINIRTLYEPHQTDQNIKIWYVIEGTVEDPLFKFESRPAMELQNIISYILFGQPFYKLDSAEQALASIVADNTTADFAAEILLDRVEAMAMQDLGVDVVRIDNTNLGGESGTAITTGWYINPKVFFAVQNVITGSSPRFGFFLEYYLNENLILILSQGNDRGQGIDLQWEYDY